MIDEDYIEGAKKGILMGYCLGCSLAYPLEDMNKQGLCEECQGGEGQMIDTDKYTGHTEGPWRVVEGAYADKGGAHQKLWGEGIHHTDLGMFFLATDLNNDIPKEIQQRRIEARLNGQRDEQAETEADNWADAYTDEWIDEIGKNLLLAQDAPLLLAEVKRLREQLRLAKEWVAKEYPCCPVTMGIFTEYIGDEEE